MQVFCIFLHFFEIPYRDLEDSMVPVYKTTAHKEIINAIDGIAGTKVGCGAPEIVTGSRDGPNLTLFRHFLD